MKIIWIILIGVLISFVLQIILVDNLSFNASEYIPVFIGSTIAAYLANRSPLVIGFVIALVLILLSIQSLIVVVYSIEKTIKFPALNLNIILQWLLYIPFGVLGAYLGFLVKRRICSK